MILKPSIITSLTLSVVVCCCSAAEKSDWAEGGVTETDGANREYYNRAAMLPWRHFMGDWRDARDTAQGDIPYAVTSIVDDDSVKPIRWDITALVKEWAAGQYPNQGIFLRFINGTGPVVFASRETGDASLAPTLLLTTGKNTIQLAAAADTWLTKSTYRSKGQSAELRLSGAPDHILIRFAPDQITESEQIDKAELILHSTKQYGNVTAGIFRCRQGHNEEPTPPIAGLAARYSHDRGIATDADVVLAADFEDNDWSAAWSHTGPTDRITLINSDSEFQQFQSLQGRALQSRIAKGSTTALNTTYRFRDKVGAEPEEIYFRYYLRLGNDWNQTVQGGKLPGISGTYGRGGWGGRKSDGRNGWSARGLFRMTVPDGNPLAGTTPIGFYCYHTDMQGSYGTNWIWNQDYRGYLKTNCWYCLEQYCRLNTPGKKDGVLRAWVDGRPAFEKTDIQFRLTDELKIEQIWLNLYHGGTIPSPYDQHVFIDNAVIARKYIGPMALR